MNWIYSHAVGVEFMTARQAHHAAHAIHILLQTYNALDLSAHVLLPFGGKATRALRRPLLIGL